MKQTITIPFNKYTNIHTQDNSGFLETADNVIHDGSGYKAAPGIVSDANDAKNLGAGVDFNLIGVFDSVIWNNTPLLYTVVSVSGGSEAYTKVEQSSPNAWGTNKFSENVHVDFCQWGEGVIAAQSSNNVQYADSSTSFADLGGTPPQANTCCVVDDFVILANTYESGVRYANRIWNSAINDETGWTAGTNLCDYDDNPELGYIHKVVGGEYCTILAENGIAIMQRVGGEVGWQIDQKIWHKASNIPMYGVVRVNNFIYYIKDGGFYVFDGATDRELGQSKVETLLGKTGTSFSGATTRVYGAYDAANNMIVWSKAGSHWAYKIETDEFITLSFPTSGSYTLTSSGATGDYSDHDRWYPIASRVSEADNMNSVSYLSREYDDTYYYLRKWDQDYDSNLTPNLETGFYELIPNKWATITRIDTIATGVTSEDIDILAYDDTKTLIDTVTLTETGGSKTRQTGRYFKFKVQSDFTRFEGLKVEFVERGSRG